MSTARMTVMEALKIMGIPPRTYESMTKESLRNVFRDLVKKVHPDRGGNDYLFDLVQQAYEVVISSRRDFQVNAGRPLQEKMQAEQAERQYAPRPQQHHYSHQNSYPTSHALPSSHPPPPTSTRDRPSFTPAGGHQARSVFTDGQSFNAAKFNEVFSEHYEADIDSKRNYNDFLKSNQRVTRDLVVYEDPSEYQSNSALSYASIGGTSGSFTSKQYTDLYEAYSEQHPDEVQGRSETFRSLDDIQKSRGQKIDMTHEDQERMRRISEMKQYHESSRQRRALDEDQRTHDHYQRLHFRLTQQ